jgi:hypothetical protein
MNKNYLPERMKKLSEEVKIVGNFFYGILLDSTAPWYTLFKPTKSYENISKDNKREVHGESYVKQVLSYCQKR